MNFLSHSSASFLWVLPAECLVKKLPKWQTSRLKELFSSAFTIYSQRRLDSQQYNALSLGAWLGELLRHRHDGLWRSALGWGRGNSRQSISTPERLVFMIRLRGSQHQGQRWYIILQDLQMWSNDSVNLAKGFSTWPTTALNIGGSTRQKLTSLALEENWWDDNFSFYNTFQHHYKLALQQKESRWKGAPRKCWQWGSELIKEWGKLRTSLWKVWVEAGYWVDQKKEEVV